MKKLLLAASVFLFAFNTSFSQSRSPKTVKTENDSTNKFNNGLKFYGNGYQLNQYSFDGSIWTKTLGMLNAVNNNNYISPSVSKNMLVPLRLQYMDTQKLSLVREILGAAQMTAVGIMAYEHIRKYGFIKKPSE